ncbi:hypothetical protein I0292_26595 (plasmid) [Priestia megaterium]|uniref:hypothetical protein n=1 Tax=Priestia megaterium TaxID=1404 RepID=UPI00205BF97E|nr:hypothetical protein [Priestia megaterium]UOO43818.1 hypothetical protein I0292_26595 [Priestia megaterium]
MSKLTKMSIFPLHILTRRRIFNKIEKVNYLKESYVFAYNMSFSSKGHHRITRSGGQEKRKQVQIFCDAFNGKLGEFAVYQYLLSQGIEVDYPDISIMGEREWDSYDFVVKEKKIGVKTTKKWGQLLLLETKDWNANGQYIPNLNKGTADYDYIILVRVDSNIIDGLEKRNLYKKDRIDKEVLKEILNESSYDFDIAGYVDKELLVEAIKNKNIIKQNEYLQSGRTKIDADNYYIQAGDMNHINHLTKILSSM